MKCSKCMENLIEGTKFCPKCGTVVEIPVDNEDSINKWQQKLPLIGAGVGLISGLISLTGWFAPWTSLKFGNGPQLILLPFGLSLGTSLLNELSFLTDMVGGVGQITGWFLLVAIVVAIFSLALLSMSVSSIWMGIKCLENRSDKTAIPLVKNLINKIGKYSLIGIIFSLIVMILVSVFQVGESSIGGGLTAMSFGFILGFISVIYLKPHLR
jgi:hypothetical protein